MKQHVKKNAFFYIVIIALIGFGGYKYFAFQVEISKMEDKWEEQRQLVSFYTKQAMDSSNIDALKFATKSLVWAIRSEMLSENKEQLKWYISELEKDSKVGDVLICDMSSSVLYSSEKRLVGKPFPNAYDQALLATKTIDIKKGENGNMYLIAPIMGLNDRIGTLFLSYRHEVPQILRAVEPLNNN